MPDLDRAIEEALRLNIRYTPNDLFVPDWAAAVLFDSEPGCNETLRVIAHAQLGQQLKRGAAGRRSCMTENTRPRWKSSPANGRPEDQRAELAG